MVLINCEKCGKEFEAQRRSRRFCSNKCQDQRTWKSRRFENYKMTWEEGSALLAKGCWVCGSMDDLHVDHDHRCCPGTRTCGECIRGVLCRRHNTAIGLFAESKDEMLRAMEYLEQFE